MLDDAALAELKAKHGDLMRLDFGPDVIVVRRPTAGEYRKWRRMSGSEDKRSDAIEVLARECAVHPTGDALNALLDRRPALADLAGAQALGLAGMSEEYEAKKL